MSKSKITFLSIFLIGFLILPLATFADQIPAGDECFPKNQPTQDQFCPFCMSGPGENGVNLKWNLGGFSSVGDIKCSLNCVKDDGVSCSPSSSFSFKDNDGFAVVVGRIPLRPGDGVKVLSPDIGNVYQMSCSQISPGRVVYKMSQKMTILGCGDCKTQVVVATSTKIGNILGKVIKYARMANNPMTCVLSAVENVCHFQLVSNDHGRVRNLIGTAIEIAAWSWSPLPAGVTQTIRLVDQASAVRGVYQMCKAYIGNNGFEPKMNLPNTEYVTGYGDD
jgi:hypothetical protein